MTLPWQKNRLLPDSPLRDDNLPLTREKFYLREDKLFLLGYSILEHWRAIDKGLRRTGFRILLSSG